MTNYCEILSTLHKTFDTISFTTYHNSNNRMDHLLFTKMKSYTNSESFLYFNKVVTGIIRNRYDE